MGAIGLYFATFGPGLSRDQAVWGQLGDFVGGLVNPVISLVGLIAVVITVRASTAAIDETRRQLQAQLFAESESHFVSLERVFATLPSALKFHGVDPKDLEHANLSPEEFSYLLANFTAGAINVRALQETDTSPFPVGDYYRTMLECKVTRDAWPLLSRLMSASSQKTRIEETIKEIDRLEKAREAVAVAAPTTPPPPPAAPATPRPPRV